MYQNIKDLLGYTIHAADGEIGKVEDFYFDDDQWTIRYLVVGTGSWLDERKVLIAPSALEEPRQKSFSTRLSRQQVKDSPDIDTHRPVSRQQEEQLVGYYGWPVWWPGGVGPTLTGGTPVFGGAVPMPVPVTGREEDDRPLNRADEDERGVEDAPPDDRRYDPNLRSFKEVSGYRINADDGEIGKMVDLIIETEHWKVMYMIVDTGGLFPGKKVLVAPSWVQAISLADHAVDVDLKAETIRKSPEWDPSRPLDRSYEEDLHRYYGKDWHE